MKRFTTPPSLAALALSAPLLAATPNTLDYPAAPRDKTVDAWAFEAWNLGIRNVPRQAGYSSNWD